MSDLHVTWQGRLIRQAFASASLNDFIGFGDSDGNASDLYSGDV
jgi:hypothetical protein